MYSSEDYQAMRQSAVIVRRADRGVLVVTGSDRLPWLQGLLTNDVLSLTPDGSCYAAYLTPQGRMITDLVVVNLSGRTLLEVPATLAAPLRVRLEALLFAEDAQISDESKMTAIVELHGPNAAVVLARAQSDLTALDVAERTNHGAYGVPSVSLYVTRDAEKALVRALAAAGAREISLETLDVLRIEAGIPTFLVDMDEHTIPLEAGIEDRAISFTKGCYVGQEVIVRVTQRGQGRVAKKLMGLLFSNGEKPRSGDLISAEGRQIGRVTSAAVSPVLQRPIALGYVHRDFTGPGTSVCVTTSEGQASATIAALPFVPELRLR